MNRDRSNKKSSKANKSGSASLLMGLLIGLLVGVALALALALFLNRGDNPFAKKYQQTKPDAIASAPVTQPVQPEILRPGRRHKEPLDDRDESDASGPERFDFYKVLPGTLDGSEKKTNASSPASARHGARGIWLQAGAFQSEQEADNLKARLALIGIEARIQTLETPDKGLWHRVRVGPFSTTLEMNKAQALLSANGIDATVAQK